MTVRIVTAGDLCNAAETTLTTGVPALLTALGLDELPAEATPGQKPYKAPSTWRQLPTLAALQTADVPAGAITSSGIIGQPRKTAEGYDATWRIQVGVFDRGSDYDDTADRARTWAAIVRAVLLNSPSLGGAATGVRWVNESYRQYPQTGVARTLGGCAVDFDVDAHNVVDLGGLAGVLPVVETTHPEVIVRPY